MATSPVLPADDEPLDARTIDLLLSSMGPDMVLVGGQALAFWMDRFRLGADDAAISNDGDVLGIVARARDLAVALEARLVLPKKTARTSLSAQLRLPVASGKSRNIDVLHMLFTIGGPRKSSDFTKQVLRNSIEVEWRKGTLIRVMDPFDVLESRAQNAVGLYQSKGPRVLTQARWAIEVARAALLRVAADPASQERLGRKIQRVFTVARSQVGKRLWSEHRIELQGAIDTDALRKLAPAQAHQLDAVQAAAERRRQRPAAKALTVRKKGTPA